MWNLLTGAAAKVQGAMSAVFPWMADDAMVMAAQSGHGIGPEAYDAIPLRMKGLPQSVMVAYEQAAYFVALGLRRAIANGNAYAEAQLSAQLDALLAEADEASDEVTAFCSMTGFGCPVRGSYAVLGDANEALRLSGLEISDSDEIRSYLKRARLGIVVRTAAPAVAVAAGTTFLLLWLNKRA